MRIQDWQEESTRMGSELWQATWEQDWTIGEEAQDWLWQKTPILGPWSKTFWVLEEERSEGRPVSNDLLRVRALQIAGGLQMEAFTASFGWLVRWKRRFGVEIWWATNTSQYVPADYANKLATFHRSVITVRKSKSISARNIINMDQRMCRFDVPPSRTNSKKGEKTVRVKTTRAE